MNNMNNACRLCGTSEGLKLKIFDPGRDFVSKIHQLLPIMVHERDPLTKLICHRCAYKLQEFYDFRELCIKTDTYLKIQISLEPVTSVTSQHVPVNPTDVQFKEERASISPPPPQLSPVLPLTLQPLQPLLSTSPLPPVVTLSRDSSVRSAPPKNLCTEVHAKNFQRTAVIPQVTHPAAASPANMVFLNSEQGEYFLPEEPEVATSDSGTDDHGARFPDLDVSEKVAAGTKHETSRKRNNPSDSVQVSKKRKKSPNQYSRSRRKNQVNGVKTVFATISPEDSNEERSRVRHKPGPKSYVRPLRTSVNAKVKEPKQKNRMKYKPGPKSQVAGKNVDLDSDNSDVEFILYKPPNSFLDVIDLTDAVESPVEEKGGSDTEEAPEPHIELTKIPGICKIYTCSLCEGTFTSASCANRHACMVNRHIPISATEVDLREEASKNKVPREVASENKAEGNGISEGVAAGQKASEKKTHECKETHNAENTSSERIVSTSSVLQRIIAETKGAENGSENDTSLAGLGSHVCDICGFRCTRLVSLASHKDRHLYPLNECEEDSFDRALFNVRKKKKRASKPVTENE